MQRIGAMLLRRAVPLLAVTTLAMLASTGAANAASFTVTTTNDSNDGTCTASLCSLRDAVEAADNAGGASTITVPAGTYKLTIAPTAPNDPTNGDLDINNNASVTITGAGSGSTVIDANSIDRAFAVQNGASLSLSRMTIQNGHTSTSSSPTIGNGIDHQSGGAIYSDGGLALTSDVTLKDNFAGDYGGAVYADLDSGSTLSVTGATFDRNGTTNDYGGAIYQDAPGTVSVTNSVFENNYTNDEDGGAIYGENGGLTVDHTTFNHNHGSDEGGAIYWDANTSVSVTNSSFTNNSAYYGGAVYDNDSSALTLSSDSFTGNSASDGGGAVYLDATDTTQYTLDHDVFDRNDSVDDDGGAVLWFYGQLTSTGSTFVNNTGGDGGAIALENSVHHPQFTLVNATISDNSAAADGGGIYVGNTTPATLTNDTITSNSANAGAGGGIYDPPNFVLTNGSQTGAGVENTIVAKNAGGDCDTTDPFTATFDQGHNLDGDTSCFTGTGASGDQLGVDPKLGGPADNGGPQAGDPNTGQVPILTDAELSGSPAIDAGTNAGCPSTDARGVSRPQGASCDMGAFEAAASNLSVSNSAPANGQTGIPFTYTITVTPSGPGPSTGTTVTDQLPVGETLYGATPSQGGCSSTGSPAKVTCALGSINVGNHATVTLLVSEANAGSVTDTATATNDQGASVNASATTKLVAPVAPAGATGPKAKTDGHAHVGKHSAKVKGHVSNGNQPTWFFFQYGKSRKLGSTSKLVRITSSKNVSATIRRLLAGKKYYYRLVAINDSGVSYGAKHHFRTKRH